MPQARQRETARLLRHGRWVLGLSQEDFAARLGLDVTEVCALESGARPDGIGSGHALAALASPTAPMARA
ncbi:helix-turn-helix domain-containing protein [Cereibacter sphaeroides]|uniref:helix-turn-helix domain-containing protein n=1 Tax=Cereibacter sphaeroides TaxID=1063 RepID=UPI001F258140|nr:helix-turn-helix domain-containing protein [Cereibacter sphaeroides]MCE6951060.1 helix-turn-helix domain-containing protein [Cereibacter sphaeroides]